MIKTIHGISYDDALKRTDKDTIYCIEGIDGSGKTSTVEALVKYYTEQGIRCAAVTALGAGPFGARIRELIVSREFKLDPWAEIELMSAMYIQVQRDVIDPLLDDGVLIILDRGMLSCLVYQGAVKELYDYCDVDAAPLTMWDRLINVLTRLPIDEVQSSHPEACVLDPSWTFYLDVPREVRMARRNIPLNALDTEVSARIEKYEEGYKEAFIFATDCTWVAGMWSTVTPPTDATAEDVAKDIVRRIDTLKDYAP